MTTPFERTRATLQAKELLQELRASPNLSDEQRRQITVVLRHFPDENNLRLAAMAGRSLHAPPFGWEEES